MKYQKNRLNDVYRENKGERVIKQVKYIERKTE